MSSTGTARREWAMGGTIFAASMMIIVGVWQALIGLAAIFQDEFFVATPNYLYSVDTTGWGWVHLGFGVLSAIAGAALFTGATWARVIGITIAGLSAINNFLFLPYYPVWALTVIAIDVFVIWSLASFGSAMRAEAAYGGRGDAFATSPEQAAAAGRADLTSAQAEAERSRLINR